MLLSDQILFHLKNVNRTSKFERLVVSLGSGTCATEWHSNEFCLCLEKDLKSVFSAVATFKGQTENKNSFTARYDYTSPLLADLLSGIKSELGIRIMILFQHPNPTMKDSLEGASKACLEALVSHTVDSIVFVYDTKPGGNCWTYDSLQSSFLGPKWKSDGRLKISPNLIASEMGCMKVSHPVFGETKRLGWAFMKKGKENCFAIERND